MNTLENKKQLIDEIREGISDYRTTIKVIQAFISLMTWDTDRNRLIPGCQFTVGRKMNTSTRNKIHPNNVATPDIVIQRSREQGYVIETKCSLPRNHHDSWLEYVEQLQKYDDDLLGWWTDDENIAKSSIVLLLDITRSGIFKNYVEQLMNENRVSFDRSFSIVEFSRTPQIKEFWYLRKYWGTIDDDVISSILETGKPVAIEKVVANPIYGEKKFYDAQPPYVEHTMEELWQHIFNELKQESEYDPKLHAWPIEVTVKQLTKELQRLYGSLGKNKREAAFPLNDWIREALDAFVYLRLAKKEADSENYTILFKLIHEDLITYFSKWRALATRAAKKIDLSS